MTPGRRWVAGLALWAALSAVIVAPSAIALAAGPPDLTLRLEAATVGVGDELHVTLQATTEDGVISDAELSVPKSFSQGNTSSGPTTSINIVNGHMTQRRGLNVTWSLRPSKPGTYEIGPASVVVGGKRWSTQKTHVTVVPAGQAPRPRQTLDPFGTGFPGFDPFKGFFQPFGQPLEPQEVPTDPKLGLDAPRGAVSFLHATVDKTDAVVGEQVTLSVYLYQDVAERGPDLADVHEATASDFLRRPLFEDDSGNRPLGNGLVAGRPWTVKLVRKSALFPLKSGDLEIGPMSLTLVGSRNAGPPLRESETLRVRVTEPPVAGRPPGYRIGDVGNFNLSADVVPHDVERGGAIGVTLELSGTGNLPSSILPPVRTGIEWLTPEVHEKMGPAGGDRFGGKRTFSFVVRMHKEGDADLGTVTLPFWNPDAHRYGLASASLGVVHVRPGAAPAPTETAFDPLASLPPPLRARSGSPRVRAHPADSPVFWLGLGGAPLAYVVVASAIGAAQGVRKRRAERKASPETELRERIHEADRACGNGDAKAAYAAIIRALESAAIARAGVNVRGALKAEIARRLEDQGVETGTAARFEELLRACETARFAPDAAPGPSGDAPSPAGTGVAAQWKEAKAAIGSLRQRAAGRPS